MATGVPGLLDKAEATRTFQNILDDPRWGGEAALSILEGGVDIEWRVLAGDDTSLAVGLGPWTDAGPAPRDAWLLSLKRQGDRWVPTGWGDCNLAPVLSQGSTWAHVNGYRAGGDDSTSLQVRVSEIECTGARDPIPFLNEPDVVETPDTVTISWTTTPMEGAATCPGNPPVNRSITLSAPLGNRQVLDGSSYPPRPVPTV
jgi:hypothetical protein